MGGLLIRGLSQTSLYRLQIKEIIVFAPHHIGEPSQICDNRAIPILPVQAYHSLAQWNSLRLQIDAHRAFRLSQLSPIITVARLSMPQKTCQSTGACDSSARSSGCGQPLPACARGSLEHRLHLIVAVLAGDWMCMVRHVGEQLVACHRHRTLPTVFLAGPTALPFFPPFPEGERPGLRETQCTTLRPVLNPTRRESERARER